MKMKTIEDESLSSMSRAIRKPLMEKRRRARMNDSLETLKQILLRTSAASLKRSQLIPSKLDKADILELTVNLVQELLGHASGSVVDIQEKIPQEQTIPWRPW